MTQELKNVISKIDVAFKEYFKEDPEIKTIFVAGSMAHDDYQDRIDNDYDMLIKYAKHKINIDNLEVS